MNTKVNLNISNILPRPAGWLAWTRSRSRHVWKSGWSMRGPRWWGCIIRDVIINSELDDIRFYSNLPSTSWPDGRGWSPRNHHIQILIIAILKSLQLVSSSILSGIHHRPPNRWPLGLNAPSLAPTTTISLLWHFCYQQLSITSPLHYRGKAKPKGAKYSEYNIGLLIYP